MPICAEHTKDSYYWQTLNFLLFLNKHTNTLVFFPFYSLLVYLFDPWGLLSFQLYNFLISVFTFLFISHHFFSICFCSILLMSLIRSSLMNVFSSPPSGLRHYYRTCMNMQTNLFCTWEREKDDRCCGRKKRESSRKERRIGHSGGGR